MADSHGLKNPDDAMAIARHEVKCSLEDVVKAASYLLVPGGSFCMVHRPFRLVEIMDTLTKYKLEPKRMQLVYPYADAEPNMVLMQCVKGANRRLKVEKPLIVYEKPGKYMQEIYDIYGY
jgi:tRNA1Val (adenine37-N6)-methyltransferase